MLGRRIPCLYGGSVNPGNCEELITCPHIDGLFIGRSAWNVEGYLDILGKCFANRLPGWQERLEEMIPSYGKSLRDDPKLYRKVRKESDRALGLV